MKKHFTILALLALTITATTQQVSANGNPTFSDKKAALTILSGQVGREVIGDLQLNEMQYIQLKELNRNFSSELAGIKASAAKETADNKTLELTNRYFASLSEILTSQQIALYVAKNVQLASK